MAKWYMTVGYDGGGFACQNAVTLFEHLAKMEGVPFDRAASAKAIIHLERGGACRPQGFSYGFRPCPPDLAEWLDAEIHKSVKLAPGYSRMKVAGGWIYETWVEPAITATFVPVAGAAGITIMEASNDNSN